MEDSTLVEDIVFDSDVSSIAYVHTERFTVVERTLLDVVCVFSNHVQHL